MSSAKKHNKQNREIDEKIQENIHDGSSSAYEYGTDFHT